MNSSRIAEGFREWVPGPFRAAILVLAGAATLAMAALLFRILCTWKLRQVYLAWNLFLACCPVVFAFASLRSRVLDRPRRVRLGWSAAWLLFLPNAPYILTDLVHLRSERHPHFWTDLLLILLFAWLGVFAGFVSLLAMHGEMTRRHGRMAGWCFVGAVTVLVGVGVYLGRFSRWNSWDILHSPFAIVLDVFAVTRRSEFKFVALFSMVTAIGYTSLYSLLASRTQE